MYKYIFWFNYPPICPTEKAANFKPPCAVTNGTKKKLNKHVLAGYTVHIVMRRGSRRTSA